MYVSLGAVLSSTPVPVGNGNILGLGGLPSWITGLGALLGIIVLVAAAIAVFFSAAAKQRTELLEATNKTLTERVSFLEREAIRKDAEYEKQHALDKAEHAKEKALALSEKNALVEKVRVLEQVVTGREQLEHLQSVLEAHDARVDLVSMTINTNQQLLTEHDLAIRHDMLLIKKSLVTNKRLLTSIMRELAKPEGEAHA